MAIYDHLIEEFMNATSVTGTVTGATGTVTAGATGTTNATQTYVTANPSGVHESAYRRLINGNYPYTNFTTISIPESNAARIDRLEAVTDNLNSILKDILGILAAMYDRDGPRIDSTSDIRAFIDSIRVIEKGSEESR